MKKRIDLEIIRIIAIIFVLINHTATNIYISTDIYNSGFLYFLYLFIAALARVAVPLFFMISGLLLIPKEESIKLIFRKRVLKYGCLIIVVSFIQYFYHIFIGKINLGVESFLEYITKMYVDSVIVPYWFLYAYLGLLIMLPFLRKMVKSMQEADFKYLIALHLLFFSALQIFEYFLNVERINLSIPFACETSFFYFILGYYIDNYFVYCKKKTVWLAVLSLLSVVLSTFMVYWQISCGNVYTDGTQYKFSSALIIFPTVLIFILVKKLLENKNISKKLFNLIKWIGGTTFGIYLFEGIFDSLTFDIYFISNKIIGIPFVSWLIWVFVDFGVACLFVSLYKIAINGVKKLFIR